MNTTDVRTNMTAPVMGASDGVHNLRRPRGLPLIVWRTARAEELARLGVPRGEATDLRRACTGSPRPAKLSRWLLATGMWGMWGCHTDGEIADAVGATGSAAAVRDR